MCTMTPLSETLQILFVYSRANISLPAESNNQNHIIAELAGILSNRADNF